MIPGDRGCQVRYGPGPEAVAFDRRPGYAVDHVRNLGKRLESDQH